MKKHILSCILSLVCLTIYAQIEKIEKTIELKTTPVKNQAMSNTCWSFATLSFFESELLRMNKGEYDLSEMYYVRMAYPIKANNYYHFQGHSNFGPGGQAHDITQLFKKFGAMPETVYSGLNGKKNHEQLLMDEALEHIMDSVVKKAEGSADKKWELMLGSIMDIHLGPIPSEFSYNGNTYSPESFAASLGLNADDYVELTSFSHHPYYESFVLEIPDNWMFEKYYNLPLEDLMAVMENSLNKGYTLVWDGDVSDKKSFANNGGVAETGNEKEKVSQETRQQAFEDFTVTDDHLMHITGLAASKDGAKYFLVKNSWGEKKGNEGYWYLSENYVRLKTIAIMVHKDVLPAPIKTRLNID
ncbi:MAG TPA: C1 family peptidase [Bacteroidales bacterium]|nr:aminopeptidase [Bacteroidales bacterium]HNZ42624.1 C1 family peptidase [Bacteroidales bacterium]HOH83577.1 C1 family peptidase [Bacteroidales bacterium]HPB26226.1 C1 family peptidase [Bacteroidales bacterium]HPI30824.1 C1 family peptidase [Bacteroidales bacterium]